MFHTVQMIHMFNEKKQKKQTPVTFTGDDEIG